MGYCVTTLLFSCVVGSDDRGSRVKSNGIGENDWRSRRGIGVRGILILTENFQITHDDTLIRWIRRYSEDMSGREPSMRFLYSNSFQQPGAKVKRPSFSVAWAASQRIYDPANPSERVAKVIGGYVEKNVNNPSPTERWSNTCAVRMSYILSEAGMVMPRIPEQTASGRDNRQYFFRVRDLIRFLEQR